MGDCQLAGKRSFGVIATGLATTALHQVERNDAASCCRCSGFPDCLIQSMPRRDVVQQIQDRRLKSLGHSSLRLILGEDLPQGEDGSPH
jgi:hypothetical protein